MYLAWTQSESDGLLHNCGFSFSRDLVCILLGRDILRCLCQLPTHRGCNKFGDRYFFKQKNVVSTIQHVCWYYWLMPAVVCLYKENMWVHTTQEINYLLLQWLRKGLFPMENTGSALLFNVQKWCPFSIEVMQSYKHFFMWTKRPETQ